MKLRTDFEEVLDYHISGFDEADDHLHRSLPVICTDLFLILQSDTGGFVDNDCLFMAHVALPDALRYPYCRDCDGETPFNRILQNLPFLFRWL